MSGTEVTLVAWDGSDTIEATVTLPIVPRVGDQIATPTGDEHFEVEAVVFWPTRIEVGVRIPSGTPWSAEGLRALMRATTGFLERGRRA